MLCRKIHATTFVVRNTFFILVPIIAEAYQHSLLTFDSLKHTIASFAMFYSVVFDRGARHSTAVGGDMDVGTGCAGDVDAWEYKLHAKNTHPLA